MIYRGVYNRISSNIVPLATHPSFEKFQAINNWDKDKSVLEAMENIRKLQQKHNLRISIHPGQYTVMNTPNEENIIKMKKDLGYHVNILKSTNGKDLIIHVGEYMEIKKSQKKDR